MEVEAAPGVTVETVAAEMPYAGSSGLVPTDRVSARAWAASTGATLVRIPTDTVVEGATVIRHHGTGSETAGAGHAVIVAEKFAKATVVLVFEGSAVVADNIEIVVEDGADLTVGQRPGLGRRRRPPRPPSTPRSAATPTSSTSR